VGAGISQEEEDVRDEKPCPNPDCWKGRDGRVINGVAQIVYWCPTCKGEEVITNAETTPADRRTGERGSWAFAWGVAKD
jgi:hypothetical protein